MKYSDKEVNRLLKKQNLSREEEITVNILVFIRTIHLNEQDFIESHYDSRYSGKMPMTFRKNAGQVLGLINVTVEGRDLEYVFSDQGFEALDQVLNLTTN